MIKHHSLKLELQNESLLILSFEAFLDIDYCILVSRVLQLFLLRY